MPAPRKRETRENVFYNVGEQGRKTGIRLEDKGVRDEYGMEPVSGIFSSPNSAGEEVGGSESMDIQESSIPDLTPGHILRNSRTNLPPPKSRSPMKTSLGASPRRSVGPRSRSVPKSASPEPDVDDSVVVTRRLDFDQGESSLQETPALSGSGARRGTVRRSVYDLEPSPVRESNDQTEASVDEDSEMFNGVAEESVNGVAEEAEEDATAGATGLEESMQEVEEESRIEEEPVKQPQTRGRKRKSDAVESAAENESPAAPSKKTRTSTTRASAAEKAKKPAQSQPQIAKARGRPLRERLSETTDEEPSAVLDASLDESVQASQQLAPPPKKSRARPPKAPVDSSIDESAQEEEAPATVEPKRRGRLPKTKLDVSVNESEAVEEEPTPAKAAQGPRSRPPKNKESEPASAKEAAEKSKMAKPAPKSKEKAIEKPSKNPNTSTGVLVDVMGNPISKAEIDEMSNTSTGSRFRRGRPLSVFRQQPPEDIGKTGRSGRVRIAPINFWLNERATYDRQNNLVAVLNKESVEEEPKKRKSKAKGKKTALAAVEEEDEELDDWEASEEGVYMGEYRDFDAVTEAPTDQVIESAIAWAQNGINPQQVPNAHFKFTKLGSAGAKSFFSFGCIELEEDDIKRSKNSRRMHMVFHVTKGAVEVMVNENFFTVHKGGVWQVPRGNNYSIRNVAKKESRVFFAQAFESTAGEE